jgi:hypothetical protein
MRMGEAEEAVVNVWRYTTGKQSRNEGPGNTHGCEAADGGRRQRRTR